MRSFTGMSYNRVFVFIGRVMMRNNWTEIILLLYDDFLSPSNFLRLVSERSQRQLVGVLKL